MSSNTNVTSPVVFLEIDTCTVTNGGNTTLNSTGGTVDKRQFGPGETVTVGGSTQDVVFKVLNSMATVLTVSNNPQQASVKVTNGTTVGNVGEVTVVVTLT